MEIAILLLLIVGVLLIVAEVFLPGGITGIFGGLCWLTALILTFMHYGWSHGAVLAICQMLALLIGFALWIRFLPRTPFARWFMLTETMDSPASGEAPAPPLTGSTGTTLSRLNPSGAARINGRRMDVTSESGLVEAGTDIRVVKVSGRRIVVRPEPSPNS